MTDITRDEFIKAVREIRPPMFSAPERQGFFLRNLDGEFTAPGLEPAYVGWCLGREKQLAGRPDWSNEHAFDTYRWLSSEDSGVPAQVAEYWLGWMRDNAAAHDVLESDETTRLDPSTGRVEMRVAASVSCETPGHVDWQVWPAALPQGTKLYYHPPQCTGRTSTGGER